MNKLGKMLAAMAVVLFISACGAGQSAPGSHDNIIIDLEGFSVALPENIETIISIGPSNTEVLVALGFGDKIIQTDIHSADVLGISPEISNLDLMEPNLEHIVSLAPDIIFVTGIVRISGEDDPLGLVSSAGIPVIYMPSSNSIARVKEDIRFMATVLDAEAQGDRIVGEMSAEIQRIREIGQSITDRKTVYFELSPAPHLVSFGQDTFLHEMIELVGAVNIFADHESWINVTDEVVLNLNPDVILTSVNFIDDPVGEVMSRAGWDSIAAVQNARVYAIDAGRSNRPSHNIVYALREIAEAIYPEKYI